MCQFWPDKEDADTIPGLLGDTTSQTIQLPVCNCGKDTLLAQILGIVWFRILESPHWCLRQFRTNLPGMIQNIQVSCNPQRLPLTLISNMVKHVSVNLFLCSSGEIILQSASYFANILQRLLSSLIPRPSFLHYSQVPLTQDVEYQCGLPECLKTDSTGQKISSALTEGIEHTFYYKFVVGEAI